MASTRTSFTDRQLAALERSAHGKGHHSTMIAKLAGELRAANALNRTLVEQAIRSRSRVVELETRFKPVGRVLMVDMPPYRQGIDLGALQIYHDAGVDFAYVSAPANDTHHEFDDLLERTMKLAQLPKRFQQMPWELSGRYETTWTRRSGADEVEALAAAEMTKAVLSALRAIEDEPPKPEPKETPW